MRIAYFECATGISGDMTLAALLDAGVEIGPVQSAVASLGLPGVRLTARKVVKQLFAATQVTVEHPPQHAHRGLAEIEAAIARADLTPRQRDRARSVFHAIAEAEAKVHGMPVEQVHFHEVGAVDSIVDIVGTAVAAELLGVDEFQSAPPPPGRGTVRIAHGVCPIPAPGTAELLRGIPLADVPIQAELTTPTGAAILKCFVKKFGPLPPMTIDAIGCGAGTMDFPDQANVLRLFVGTSRDSAAGGEDRVLQLETNLDHCPGEVLGYVRGRLMEAGALDVWLTPIDMKKDRPGVMLSVLGPVERAAVLEELLFRETGTLGIRRRMVERVIQQRASWTVTTPWGSVLGKLAWRGSQAPSFSPEFDDCAALAVQFGVPVADVMAAADRAWRENPLPVPPAASTEAPAARHHAHDHAHDHSHDHGHDHSHDHGHSHDHHHDHHHDH